MIIPLTLEILEDMKSRGTHVDGVSYDNSPVEYTSKIFEANEYNKNLALHTSYTELEIKDIHLYTVDTETGVIARNDFHTASYRIITVSPVLPKVWSPNKALEYIDILSRDEYNVKKRSDADVFNEIKTLVEKVGVESTYQKLACPPFYISEIYENISNLTEYYKG